MCAGKNFGLGAALVKNMVGMKFQWYNLGKRKFIMVDLKSTRLAFSRCIIHC